MRKDTQGIDQEARRNQIVTELRGIFWGFILVLRVKFTKWKGFRCSADVIRCQNVVDK